jgi:hypothetical protein
MPNKVSTAPALGSERRDAQTVPEGLRAATLGTEPTGRIGGRLCHELCALGVGSPCPRTLVEQSERLEGGKPGD